MKYISSTKNVNKDCSECKACAVYNIDVKNFFYVFYFGHVFTFLNVFYFVKVFFKNVGKIGV